MSISEKIHLRHLENQVKLTKGTDAHFANAAALSSFRHFLWDRYYQE